MRKKPNSIAVFYLCGLGDAICSLPGLFALARTFPKAQITLIYNEKSVCFFFSLLDHEFGLVDISEWPKMNLIEKAKALRVLRTKEYDVILSRAQGNTWKIPLLIWACKGKLKIGGTNERLWFVYDRTVPIDFVSTHTLYRFLRLASFVIGEEIRFTSWEELNIHFCEGKDIIRQRGLINSALKQKTVLIVPGCSGKRRGSWLPNLKQWPAAHYQELITLLLGQGWNVVLVGSPKETQVASSIVSTLGTPDGLLNVCGKTSLTDLVFLAKNSDVVIGHDSGILHLAAMLGKRVIALFGPTSPEQFAPEGRKVDVIWGSGECRSCFPNPTCSQAQCKVMEQINPQQVIDVFVNG